MNLSFSRGDEPERVRENFRRMAESIGFSEENLVFSMQTHTTNVRRVGKEDCGRGLLRPVGYPVSYTHLLCGCGRCQRQKYRGKSMVCSFPERPYGFSKVKETRGYCMNYQWYPGHMTKARRCLLYTSPAFISVRIREWYFM